MFMGSPTVVFHNCQLYHFPFFKFFPSTDSIYPAVFGLLFQILQLVSSVHVFPFVLHPHTITKLYLPSSALRYLLHSYLFRFYVNWHWVTIFLQQMISWTRRFITVIRITCNWPYLDTSISLTTLKFASQKLNLMPYQLRLGLPNNLLSRHFRIKILYACLISSPHTHISSFSI